MAEVQKCPTCGNDLPENSPGGHCPHCLLQLGLTTGGDTADTRSTIRIELPPESPLAEKPGDRIGRYKLLQQLGEGGCGVVYMADQSEPVRRRVALKVIKPGMDSKQVLARFEAERQALALMDHPNIAKVLDAGATETGRPYFVMELVKGIPITRYCDEKQLDTKQRLDLFVLVCQAIQHAHQKGIIHRDIKPSNILVADHDGTPVPKIIDFGIAKATTDQRLTDKTLFTAFEQFIGTPAYMSPEQATLSGLDIDTRSDIYSLGVLLYELLTGKTPFDAKELLAKGLDEIRRVIREVEPQRPSTRLSTLDAVEQTTVAHQRQSEPPKLQGIIRGDLDWIVMKALEKDRTRRYETANGLAVDILRHLNNEPVVARPPSNLYRFQKLVRRNKIAVAASTTVTVALLAGLIASSWQALRARRAERLAIAEREHAQGEATRADLNAQAETRQRKLAEQAVQKATQVLAMSLTLQGEQFTKDRAFGKALTYFASACRIDQSNHIAAQRIISLLNQHDFPLPLPNRPARFQAQKEPSFNARELVAKMYKGNRGELYQNSEPAVSADGKKLALVTDANATLVLSAETGDILMPEIRTFVSGARPLVRFSPDSQNLVVSGTGNVATEIWSLKQQQMIARINSPSMPYDIHFSKDGRLMVSGLRNGETHVWKATNGQLAREPCPGNNYVSQVRFSAAGDYISAVDGQTGKTRYWDARPGVAIPLTSYGGDLSNETRRPWTSARAIRRNAIFSNDGSLIAARGGDFDLCLFKTTDGSPVFNLPDTNLIATTFALSSDAKLLAVGDIAGAVSVWALTTGVLAKSFKLHTCAVSDLVLTSDNRRMASGSEDGTVKLVELSTDEVFCLVDTAKHGPVMDLDLASDDTRLAVTYKERWAEVWDLNKRQLVGKPLTKNQGWVWSARFSHTGKWLTTSSGGNATLLWDSQAEKDQPLASYTHGSGVWYARFNADDTLLLTSSYDFSSRIWETVSGRPVSEPLWHQKSVYKAEFSPDGRKVITASEDWTARVWDVATGLPLSEPLVHSSAVHSACFSPDGRHILTAEINGTARVHDWVDARENSPPWLCDLAEVVGGYHLNEKGVAELLNDTPEKLEQIHQTLVDLEDKSPLARWGRWYLSDRSTRGISPYATLSVKAYAARLANSKVRQAVDDAVALAPDNPAGYEQLALFVEHDNPETAMLYRKIAAELRGLTSEPAQ